MLLNGMSFQNQTATFVKGILILKIYVSPFELINQWELISCNGIRFVKVDPNVILLGLALFMIPLRNITHFLEA